MIKPILTVLLALSPSHLLATTTYECEATTGEHVLVQVESYNMQIEAKNIPNLAERVVFPSLNPFLEKEPAKLSSLTHVAEMTSYTLAAEESAETKAQSTTLIFAKVTIDHSDVTVSRVLFDLIDFGSSIEFEVLCDKTRLWTSPLQVI